MSVPRLLGLVLALSGLWIADAPAQPTPADTLYVDQDATGAGDGSSWADAYPHLQDALHAARTNGTTDAVWVAAGTYHPDAGSTVADDDRTASFRVEEGVHLYGHFSGGEDRRSDRTLARGGPTTVLSGEIQQDADSTNNAYTVLRLTGGTAGALHVTGGSATGDGPQGRGGGVRMSGGTLHHVVLRGNRATRGAALAATGRPQLDVLLVHRNHATGAGALSLTGDTSRVTHVTIADNTADQGATGLLLRNSGATIEDFALGPNTTVDISQTVQATINVSPSQEGVPLDTARVELRHAAQDTLIAETSITGGSASIPFAYPDDDAFTASLITDSPEHRADTTAIDLAPTDSTYDAAPSLLRTEYTVTTEATDAETGGLLDIAGALIADQDTLASYQTGDDGEATRTITTEEGSLDSKVDKASHEANMTTLNLTGAEFPTVAHSVTPVAYITSGDVTDDGTALSDAEVILDEPDGNKDTVQVADDGAYADTATVNQGWEPGETVSVTAVAPNYKDSTKTRVADPDNPSQTVNFDLDPETQEATFVFNRKMVGDQITNYDPNPADSITVVHGDTTRKAFTNGTASFTVQYASGDTVTVVNQNSDAIDTFVAFNNGGPDLSQDFAAPPEEPDHQSNYGGNADTPNNVMSIAAENLADTTELRYFSPTSPEGHSTADEYPPHIAEGRNNRFASLGGYDSLRVVVEQGNSDEWLNRAVTVTQNALEYLPVPTTDIDTLTLSEISDVYDQRSGKNLMWVREGSAGYTIFKEGPYIESSAAQFSGGYGVAREEVWGALYNHDDTDNHDIMDTINTGNNEQPNEFIPREAKFVGTYLNYNLISDSGLEDSGL